MLNPDFLSSFLFSPEAWLNAGFLLLSYSQQCRGEIACLTGVGLDLGVASFSLGAPAGERATVWGPMCIFLLPFPARLPHDVQTLVHVRYPHTVCVWHLSMRGMGARYGGPTVGATSVNGESMLANPGMLHTPLPARCLI